MDMTSVDDVVFTARPDDWRTGDTWLAGGTVLFSYGVDLVHGRPSRLLDITAAGWAPIVWNTDERTPHVEIAATCTIADVYALPLSAALPVPRRTMPGLDLLRPCCDAFVASWKIWNVSTVGGNVATALPAGPMTSLLAGLDATATVLGPDGAARRQAVADLVTGEAHTTLAPGELIRSFRVDLDRLSQPCAFRRVSLTERGRSAALLIGRRTGAQRVRIAVTASTRRPHLIDLGPDDEFPATCAGWTAALAARIGAEDWHDDIHGAPSWREAMTGRLGSEILAELLPDHDGDTCPAAGRTTGDLHLDRSPA